MLLEVGARRGAQRGGDCKLVAPQDFRRPHEEARAPQELEEEPEGEAAGEAALEAAGEGGEHGPEEVARSRGIP